MTQAELENLKDIFGLENVVVVGVGSPATLVLCDLCNADYSTSDESGGFVLSSYGVCPKCEDQVFADCAELEEYDAIVAVCREGESHRDFIVRYRGADRAEQEMLLLEAQVWVMEKMADSTIDPGPDLGAVKEATARFNHVYSRMQEGQSEAVY